MQMLALLCVWLVAIVGTAQVAHVHGDWLPKTDTHLSAPGLASEGLGEEHCPLCVAMHTTLPTTVQVVPEPVQEVSQRLSTNVLVAPQKQWSFAMFSRPPPSAGLSLILTMAA